MTVAWEVRLGECVEAMRAMPADSVDAIVCDPPYGLEFMGKEWDRFGEARDARTAGRAGEGAQTGGAGFTAPGGSGPFQGEVRGASFGGKKPMTWRCSRCRKRDQFRAHSPSVPGCDGEWIAEPVYEGAPRAMLGFQAWCESWAREALRVLKPGGHLVAFGGSRTYHRLAAGIEDAGFEIRDQLQWLYGSGFPKSLDVSKAIDKAAGAAREVVGANPNHRDPAANAEHHERRNGAVLSADVTAPATPDAQRWAGWGTALKPAHEPIVLARKPLGGSANVQADVEAQLRAQGVEGEIRWS